MIIIRYHRRTLPLFALRNAAADGLTRLHSGREYIRWSIGLYYQGGRTIPWDGHSQLIYCLGRAVYRGILYQRKQDDDLFD